MAVAAERLPALRGLAIIENCNPEKAEDFQVEEYLLEQVKKVLGGEEEGVLIASYTVKPKDEIPLCMMPEEIELEEGQRTSVEDYQWFHAAGKVVYALGFELHDVVGELRKKLEEQKWPRGGKEMKDEEGNRWVEQRTKEVIWPVEPERMRDKLSSLETKAQCELVMMGKRRASMDKTEEESCWQILVRKRAALLQRVKEKVIGLKDRIGLAVIGEGQYIQE